MTHAHSPVDDAPPLLRTQNADEIVLLIKHRPGGAVPKIFMRRRRMIGGGRLMKWRRGRDAAAGDRCESTGLRGAVVDEPTSRGQSWQRVNELSASPPTDNYGMSARPELMTWYEGRAVCHRPTEMRRPVRPGPARPAAVTGQTTVIKWLVDVIAAASSDDVILDARRTRWAGQDDDSPNDLTDSLCLSATGC